LAFAVSNVLSRRAQALSVPAKAVSVWAGVVAVAALVSFVEPRAMDGWAAAADHAPVVGALAAVMCGVTLAMQYGLTHTPANRAIVILLFELVVAAVAAYFLADETLAPRDWIGGAMIVAASLASGRMEESSR
jgi:drug/metabolite transporter (DMT)-like permease